MAQRKVAVSQDPGGTEVVLLYNVKTLREPVECVPLSFPGVSFSQDYRTVYFK